MLSITIAGNNQAEFSENFSLIAKRFGFVSFADLQNAAKAAQAKQPAEKPAVESPPTQSEADPLPKSDDIGSDVKAEAPKPRRGRQPAAEKAPAPAAEAKPLAVEDVQAALRGLAEKEDMPACRELLAHFKVKRASEVKEEDRAAFVAYAEDFKKFLAEQPDAAKKIEAARKAS